MGTATQPTTSPAFMLKHLPAIFQEHSGDLTPFLEVCEAILLGSSEPVGGHPGLADIAARVHTYLDPASSENNFLPWLASWLALTLRADLEPERQKALVSQIVPLYRWRGTRRGIEQLLALVTGLKPVITEPEAVSLEVGRAVVGNTTRLGGERPHYFEVRIELPGPSEKAYRDRIEALAHDMIELSKPAHTYYQLTFSEAAPRAPVGRPRERRSANAVQ